MTILRDALRLWAKAPNIERPALTAHGFPGLAMTGTAASPSIPNLLGQYSQMPVLYRAVALIAQGVAATDWRWHILRPNGEHVDPPANHPLLALWDRVNPYWSRGELLETAQQHMELTGESWWLIVRGKGNLPQELWPLRPDRMRPIPDRAGYIKGYIYTIGSERVPLEVDDVVFIRNPSPTDPYRGMGPVQSLLTDLGADKDAAEWTRAFFRNNAQPGGWLEFDAELSDADWERMVDRYREMHQGVSNAHRIAVVERGKFHEARYSMQDMQFSQLRHDIRDLVVAAFGVPMPMLGTMEAPSRANAEAAEYIFAKWVIRPRLCRIADKVNAQLAPLFGQPVLHLSFIDPTPANRPESVEAAERLYKAQLITRNEGRELVGMPMAEEGGDEFISPTPSLQAFGGGARPVLTRAGELPGDSPMDREERRIASGWARRLRSEATALVNFLEDLSPNDRGLWPPRWKLELSDLAGHNWDWWERHADEVIEELTRAFRLSVVIEWPQVQPMLAQQLAVEYARNHAGELLKLDGNISMARATQERVRDLTARALDEGQSVRSLARQLRDDYVFSRDRARTVARTETAIAQGQGAKGAAAAQGRNEKHWITQADDVVDEDCEANEAAGWIGFTEAFPSGVDTVPQHPACRCSVRYRTVELHQDGTTPLRGGPTICPRCGKRSLVVNRDGPGLWCRRCAQAVDS